MQILRTFTYMMKPKNGPTTRDSKNFRSLTHLALACCGGPEELAIVTPKLPVLKYVAICHYKSGEYYNPIIDNGVPIEVYGIILLTFHEIEREGKLRWDDEPFCYTHVFAGNGTMVVTTKAAGTFFENLWSFKRSA